MVSFGCSVLPFTLIILGLHFSLLRAQGDAACLQQLKGSIVDPNSHLANWKFGGSSDVCSFTGVQCQQSKVYSVKLSGMSLSGGFPQGLPLCTGLQELDLSGNDFSGNLPLNVYSCTSLTMLRLQHNQFSGVIPWQIGFLPQLTDLDLSYNNFSGEIPSTFTQRQYVGKSAFPASAFAGNPGLCGPPLATTCTAF